VRLSDFWARMEAELGPTYARSYAEDQVLSELGGKTVMEALASGRPTKEVWRAVAAALELPAVRR
jgi:Protein of unknown function (DUF3046)